MNQTGSLKVLLKCFPTNMWYYNISEEYGGGTVWHGTSIWLLSQMKKRFIVPILFP